MSESSCLTPDLRVYTVEPRDPVQTQQFVLVYVVTDVPAVTEGSELSLFLSLSLTMKGKVRITC